MAVTTEIADKAGLYFVNEDGEILDDTRLAEARFAIARNSKALSLVPLFNMKVKPFYDGYPKILLIKENDNESRVLRTRETGKDCKH